MKSLHISDKNIKLIFWYLKTIQMSLQRCILKRRYFTPISIYKLEIFVWVYWKMSGLWVWISNSWSEVFRLLFIRLMMIVLTIVMPLRLIEMETNCCTNHLLIFVINFIENCFLLNLRKFFRVLNENSIKTNKNYNLKYLSYK